MVSMVFPSNETQNKNIRILIVEDDKLIAQHLGRQLEKCGYTVLAVVISGEEALEKVKQALPDLILMDIYLAGQLNGIETAAKIQADFDLPIIYLTAYSQDAILQQAKETAPFGYLIKPFQRRELYATIEMALYRHELENRLKESEELHRITLSNISDAVFITNDKGDFTFICPNVDTIFQYTLAEVQAMGNITRLIGENVFDLPTLKAQGEIKNIEREITDKSGRQHTVLINVKKVSIQGGTILYTCRDFTERKQIEEKLARESEVNAVMAEVAHTLISPMPLRDISYRVLEHARRLTGSEFGFVGYIDPDTGYLVSPTLTRDIWDGCQVKDKDFVFEEFAGLWGWVLENHQPLLTNTPAQDSRSSGIPNGHLPIHRFLSAPALLDDTLVGQIALANPDRDYTNQDLAVVERLADLYALAIQRRQAETALQQAHDELETRVEERTAELAAANESLKTEITERKRAEQELQEALEKMRIAYQQATIYAEELKRDIAERRRAEQSLRESEEKFRTLLESAPVSVVITNHAGRIVLVNAETVSMFGYDRAELLGRPVELLIPESLRDHHINHRADYLAQPVTRMMGLGLDLLGRHKSGTTFPVEVGLSFAEIKTESLIISFVTDLSERKQAEEAIRQSQQKYETVVNSIDGIVWEADAGDFQFTFVSRQAERILGYPVDRWLADPTFWQDHIHPDDRQWAISYCSKATIEKRDEFEYRMLAADGTVVWLRDIVTVIVQNGQPAKLRGLMIDITHRKQIEEVLYQRTSELRAIFDAFPDLYFQFDHQGRFVDYHAGPNTELFTVPDNFLNRKIEDVLPPVLARKLNRMLDETLETASMTTLEYGLRQAGAEKQYEARLVPILDDHVFAIVRDITERKQAEEKIKAALREKEVLLKEIHHRVKNNLQIISSLLYLQSRNIEDQQTLDMFIEGQNRVRSMALVHEKLYKSQDLARVDVAEYIRSLTGYLFQTYGVRVHDVTLKTVIDPVFLGVDTAIPCGLIINELVSNALKYAFPLSPAAGTRGEQAPGEISIQLRVGADDLLTLTVQDNGVGFPAGVDYQNTESLGLRLVNTLVRQLDGTLELEQNSGTIFRITFSVLSDQPQD